MKVNVFYNEKCEITMEERLPESSIDLIITSPPYNYSKRKGGPGDVGKYDVYVDWRNEDDYICWNCGFDYRTIKDNEEYTKIQKKYAKLRKNRAFAERVGVFNQKLRVGLKVTFLIFSIVVIVGLIVILIVA